LLGETEESAEAFNKPQFSNAAASAAFAVHDMKFALNERAQPDCYALAVKVAPDF